MRAVKRLLVAYAETYHAGYAEVHGVDVAEISHLLGVELLLRSRHACRRHHVDEAVGVVVDEPYALVARLRRYHHDDANVVAVGDGFHYRLVVGKWKVGDDDARHAAVGEVGEELLVSIMQYRVEIPHEYQWYRHFILDGLELREKQSGSHAVLQGYGSCRLYHGAVGERVAEGHAHFHEVDAVALHGLDHIRRAVQGGAAGTEIQAEQFPVATVGKYLIDFVHSYVAFTGFPLCYDVLCAPRNLSAFPRLSWLALSRSGCSRRRRRIADGLFAKSLQRRRGLCRH